MAEEQPKDPQLSPETAPTPATSHARVIPVGPDLDKHGEALMALLPGPLASFEPEITSALDEVMVTVTAERLLEVCDVLKPSLLICCRLRDQVAVGLPPLVSRASA